MKTGPKDYFLDLPAAGLWAHLDAITIGIQASLEHRLEVDGDITMLVTRLSGLASLGYAETAAHADFRVALFTVGGSVGYRRAWRNYTLPNDVDNTAKIRREMDRGESPFERNAINWPWAEGRIRAVIPLESLWLVTNGALRHESGPGNAFDWFHTNVHDGGLLWRADATLFVRHEDYGAIGPAIRYMRYPKKGKQVTRSPTASPSAPALGGAARWTSSSSSSSPSRPATSSASTCCASPSTPCSSTGPPSASPCPPAPTYAGARREGGRGR